MNYLKNRFWAWSTSFYVNKSRYVKTEFCTNYILYRRIISLYNQSDQSINRRVNCYDTTHLTNLHTPYARNMHSARRYAWNMHTATCIGTVCNIPAYNRMQVSCIWPMVPMQVYTYASLLHTAHVQLHSLPGWSGVRISVSVIGIVWLGSRGFESRCLWSG